jgi:EAL domain-containing protein (putative c-di-GMP-specific phosphodiesterase class I)
MHGAGPSPSQPAWTGFAADAGGLDANGLIRRALDPLELMQRVADQARSMIGGAEGALVGLLIGEETLRYVCGSGNLTKFVGEPLKLEGSLSGRAIRDNATLITDDTESDPRVNRSATRSFNVRSSICVPLGRGGEPVGIINVSASAPKAFDEHDVALLSSLADFMSTVIGAASDFMTISSRLMSARHADDAHASGKGQQVLDADLAGRFVASVLNPAEAEETAARRRIEELLRDRAYSVVFQPVFDLATGCASGFEALARFGDAGSPPPDVWLAEAHRVGLGLDLEVALVEEAITHLESLPPGAVMAVNAGPEAIASARIAGALAGADASRIVVELTEHVAVEDYPMLGGILSDLRNTGVRLAIDDAGAGFASLMHILKLAPDFIKLDRQLISGIDTDPVRQCLASSLVRFAEETGAAIIAEGVETAAELRVLDDLGIGQVQGFYLARPAAIRALEQSTQLGSARVRGGRDAELEPLTVASQSLHSVSAAAPARV